MKKDNTFAKLLLPYSKDKLWVVLSLKEKKVFGKGRTIKEAIENTKIKKTEVEDLTIIQAIPDYSGLAPFSK